MFEKDKNKIPGIDIPKKERERVNDGNFKNSKIAGLSSAGAYDFLDQLQTRLIEKNFVFDDFSLKENKPFHPGESNGYLGLIVSISGVNKLMNSFGNLYLKPITLIPNLLGVCTYKYLILSPDAIFSY